MNLDLLMVETPMGIVPVTRTYTTEILLHYYAKDTHETVDTALIQSAAMDEELNLDDYEKLTVTIISTT